jgi:hypothetical protein
MYPQNEAVKVFLNEQSVSRIKFYNWQKLIQDSRSNRRLPEVNGIADLMSWIIRLKDFRWLGFPATIRRRTGMASSNCQSSAECQSC